MGTQDTQDNHSTWTYCISWLWQKTIPRFLCGRNSLIYAYTKYNIGRHNSVKHNKR
jgi:hypothetical protein